MARMDLHNNQTSNEWYNHIEAIVVEFVNYKHSITKLLCTAKTLMTSLLSNTV